MTVRPLENARWGFESNCYVCSPANARGLQLPFFHDEDAHVVFAELTPPEELQGAPTYVHGGATLAMLDEAMAWAAIAVGGKFAVTHETATTFDHPVRIGRPYRVEARLVDQTPERIRAESVVLDGKGRPCVREARRSSCCRRRMPSMRSARPSTSPTARTCVSRRRDRAG